MIARLAAATALLCALCIPGSAWAFHAAGSYELPVTDPGGAGGVYFTGSPRFRGYTCDSCHIESPGLVSLQITSDPPDLAAGRFTPGQLYSITVTLIGETRGLSSGINENGMVADLVDDGGGAVGRYEQSETAFVVDDGRAIAGRAIDGNTAWQFWYTAPDTTEPFTLYVSAVDGNGRDELVQTKVDPFGDDVASAMLRICAAGGRCDPIETGEPLPESAAGCAVGSSPSPLAILALFALFFRKRRGSK